MWSCGSNRSCGVAILIKPDLDCTVTKQLRDHEGRIIAASVQVDNTELNIMNIYAPNKPSDRKPFMEQLWRYKPGEANLMLAGDFNCIENLDLDKQGGNPLSGNLGAAELRTVVDNNQLTDTWRRTHPTDHIYTWSNQTFTLRRWYIPATLHPTAISCVRACPHSDNSVAQIIAHPDNVNRRGRGAWKLNNALLKD